MTLIDSATISVLFVVVALAVVAGTVLLGMVVRDYLADRRLAPVEQLPRPAAEPVIEFPAAA